MKLSPTINLVEFGEILRTALAEKFNCEIEQIVVESYDKPRIVITFGKAEDGGKYAMIDCAEFKHCSGK